MPTTHLAAEIATQPADWRAVLSRVPEARAALPAEGARVAVTGCGTSFYMAQAYAALREAAGHGYTDAHAASEFPLDRDYDHVVAISRSGTTTEVVELLEALRVPRAGHHRHRRHAGTPIPALAKHQLMLRRSTSSRWCRPGSPRPTLALLRATLGEDLTAAIADAEAVLAEDEDTALAGLRDAEQITFVGRGWTIGLAPEAALKLRESAQFWTEAYPAMEYRHGPISIATAGRATWAFGEVPDGLADDVRATGAHFEHRAIDPMADLVRLHRLCVAKAEQAGVDPDRPRHLSRSIILT